MALTRKQFDILAALADSEKALTQRELEKTTGHSLGTVNKTSKELSALGYIEDGKITVSGADALSRTARKERCLSPQASAHAWCP